MAAPGVARRADGNWARICNLTETPSVGDRDGGPCVRPAFISSDPYRLAVSGYAMPLLVLLTVVTNCLVCAVLLRRSMRTPTNVVLVAMAVSDMLTGVSTMPAFIKFFTLGAYVDYMPYEWFVVVPLFTFCLVSLSLSLSVHLRKTNKIMQKRENLFDRMGPE